MVSEETVLQALRGIRDPDRQQDIVTLGLVRDLQIADSDVSFTLACSPRDNLVATVASDGQIRIWDALHGELRMTFPWRPTAKGNEHLDLKAVAFAPSGQTLAVAGLQVPRNSLKLFETSTGKARLELEKLAGIARSARGPWRSPAWPGCWRWCSGAWPWPRRSIWPCRRGRRR